jgi:hypothetical protein
LISAFDISINSVTDLRNIVLTYRNIGYRRKNYDEGILIGNIIEKKIEEKIT